jgi:hypothetical protein
VGINILAREVNVGVALGAAGVNPRGGPGTDSAVTVPRAVAVATNRRSRAGLPPCAGKARARNGGGSEQCCFAAL